MTKPPLLAAFALALSLWVTGSPAASGQESFGLAGPPSGPAPESPLPLFKLFGTGEPAKTPVFALDPLDNVALAQTADAAMVQGKPRQLGVARASGIDAAMGEWRFSHDGGSVWTLDMRSPGAVAVRLLLTDIALPGGALLAVWAPGNPGTVHHFSEQSLAGAQQLYTPTVFGDTARIELYLPPGEPIGPLPFGVGNMQHLFRHPLKNAGGDGGLPRGGEPGVTPTVGNCHNDVTCFSAWANVARAVGLYLFSTGSGTSQCTGQLISTSNNDLTPYFITAAHCVNTAAEASSVEVYWFFQTASCNGASPNDDNSPRTNGATLIATRSQSDGTLLRLTGGLPGNLFWVGWNSAAITNGTQSASIHHPDGSWKRISFASATDAAGCTLGTQAETINAAWSSGVTEPGSSGGGLFRNDTQQLIGTLSCGPSFCGAPSGSLNDGYGRFASFYPSIASFLAGGSDDTLEENDSCAAARSLSPVANTPLNNAGLTVKITDEDWYRYTVPAGATLAVTLTFDNAIGTVNGQLFTTCGGSVLASSTGSGGTRTLSFVNTGAADEVFVRIYLTGTSTVNAYSMATLITSVPSAPANNTCASAPTIVSGGTYAGTTVNATTDGQSSCPSTAAARTRPDVWYAFTAPSAGTLQVDTCLSSPTDTVVSIHTACPGSSSNQIGCNDDAGNTGPCAAAGNLTSYATAALTLGQTAYVRVSMWSATTAPFTLRANFVPALLPNDTCSGALTVVSGSTPFNTNSALTEGTTDAVCNYFGYSGVAKDLWYRYTADCTGDLVIDTCGSQYDTKLAVYTACPSGNNTAIACDDDADPACSSSSLHSRVLVQATSGSTYLIRVGGYLGGQGATSGAGVLNINCAPVTPPCPADVGAQGGLAGQDGQLDNNDFVVFIDLFFNAQPAADLGIQGGIAGSDGQFDNNDFIVFIDLFFAGCP